MDAANQSWTDTHGYDNKVLDYEGVGRINVRRTSQTPHTSFYPQTFRRAQFPDPDHESQELS